MAVDRLIYEFSERGIAGLRTRISALRKQISDLLKLQARIAKGPVAGGDKKLAKAARFEVRARQVEITRLQDAIKGLAAPTKRATTATRGFRKSLRGMNKTLRLSRGLMLLHAGLMAGRMAQSLITATVGFIKLAGNIQVARQQFETTSEAMGTMSDTFLPRLREATLNTISDFELMRLANFALNAGLKISSEQFAQLSEAAIKLAKITGRDATEALQRLTFGIVKQERRILDELGIVVRAGDIFKRFGVEQAIAAGKTEGLAKQQAFLAAVLESTTEKLTKFNNVNFESATIGERVEKRFEDIKNRIAEIFVESGAAESAINFLNKILNEVEEFFADRENVKAFFSVIESALRAILQIGLALIKVLAALAPLLEKVSDLAAPLAGALIGGSVAGLPGAIVGGGIALVGSLFSGGGAASETASAVQAGLAPSMAQARGERSEIARVLRNKNIQPDIVSTSMTVSPT